MWRKVLFGNELMVFNINPQFTTKRITDLNATQNAKNGNTVQEEK